MVGKAPINRPLVIISALVVLALLVLLVKLGLWQLTRADQKLALEQLATQRQSIQWQSLPSTNIEQSINQQRIKLSGHLLHQHTWLLDNRVKDGLVGYEVLVPLLVSSSNQLIIVNLGWIRASLDRSVLPTLQQWQGQLTLAGQLHFPSKNPYSLTAPPSQQWPQMIGDIDINNMANHLNKVGQRTVPFGAIFRLSPDSNVGYQKSWRWGNKMTVEKHQGYAFQWFALAFTLVVLTAYFSTRLYKES